MLVLYRLGAWSYLLARALVRLPHFSLVNLVLGRGVVPGADAGRDRAREHRRACPRAPAVARPDRGDAPGPRRTPAGPGAVRRQPARRPRGGGLPAREPHSRARPRIRDSCRIRRASAAVAGTGAGRRPTPSSRRAPLEASRFPPALRPQLLAMGDPRARRDGALCRIDRHPDSAARTDLQRGAADRFDRDAGRARALCCPLAPRARRRRAVPIDPDTRSGRASARRAAAPSGRPRRPRRTSSRRRRRRASFSTGCCTTASSALKAALRRHAGAGDLFHPAAVRRRLHPAQLQRLPERLRLPASRPGRDQRPAQRPLRADAGADQPLSRRAPFGRAGEPRRPRRRRAAGGGLDPARRPRAAVGDAGRSARACCSRSSSNWRCSASSPRRWCSIRSCASARACARPATGRRSAPPTSPTWSRSRAAGTGW